MTPEAAPSFGALTGWIQVDPPLSLEVDAISGVGTLRMPAIQAGPNIDIAEDANSITISAPPPAAIVINTYVANNPPAFPTLPVGPKVFVFVNGEFYTPGVDYTLLAPVSGGSHRIRFTTLLPLKGRVTTVTLP